MSSAVEIDDPDDFRLADYRSLTDVALRMSFEAPHGLFIAEGALVIERALDAGFQLRSALMTADWLAGSPWLARTDAPVYLGSDEASFVTGGVYMADGGFSL